MLSRFVLLAALGLSACTATRPADPAATATQTSDVRTNENLHSVLWTQTAIEYEATARQAFELARLMLDRALADTAWTAAVEQQDDAGALPPAVILDVDETVLDNSAYQARLVLDDSVFERATWQAWVEEAQAPPVPGALAFTQYAADRGVAVFYVTNRRAETETATQENLARLGFPLVAGQDRLLLRGEQPAWTSDKTTRRQVVTDRYRVLLLVGDNVGDFVAAEDLSLAERQALSERYQAYWGTRWIMLPNPQYGSWDGALIDYDYGLSRADQLRRKYEQLDPKR